MSILPLFLTLVIGGRVVSSHLLRELEVMPASAIVCATAEQCRQQFSNMSATSGGAFFAGDFPTKGCFTKNGNVYFGTGSVVEEELAETDLPGSQERIWCENEMVASQPTIPTMQPSSKSVLSTAPSVGVGDGSSSVPTIGQPTQTPVVDSDNMDVAVCRTEDQCREKFSSMSSGGEFNVGDFPTKGCFLKGVNGFFGIGSTDEVELTEKELPGIQERIWCDGVTEVPIMSPSEQPTADPTQIPVTTSPTKQPTLMPMTSSPTKLPTFMPMTASPTDLPTLMPMTASPTDLPTFMPMTASPTDLPTSMPMTASPTELSTLMPMTATPTEQLTLMPVTPFPTEHLTVMPVTAFPTEQLTVIPVTASPTSLTTSEIIQQTGSPSQGSISDISSNSPTLHPSQITHSPSVSQITLSPSLNPVQNTSGMVTEAKPTTSPSITKTSSVTLSPFELSIQTDPGTYSVDSQELKNLVSIHLLETMKVELKSSEATKLDINIQQISGQSSRQLQPSGLIFASDSNTTNAFVFTLSGVAYFIGSSVPTVKALDQVTLESFAGKSGEEFVHSLQNAEDSGLRTTRSVDAESSSEASQKDEIALVENQLNQTDDDTVDNKRMSLLAIVFAVGLLLVAMYAMKTRRGRKIEQEQREIVMYDDIIDEESPSESEFPTYIEVQKPDEKVDEPWFDVSCYRPWFFGSQPETTDVANETKTAQIISDEVPISSNTATDFDVMSTDNSQGLSKTLSVFPKDLHTLSGESETEKNQEPLHGWEICGGYDVEHTSASNNDTNSSSLEDQNRVSGSVWGEKPSNGAVLEHTIDFLDDENAGR